MNSEARVSPNQFTEVGDPFIGLLCCKASRLVKEMVSDCCISVRHNTQVFKAVKRVIKKGLRLSLITPGKSNLLVYEEGAPPGGSSRKVTFVNKKGHPIPGLPRILYDIRTMELTEKIKWPS